MSGKRTLTDIVADPGEVSNLNKNPHVLAIYFEDGFREPLLHRQLDFRISWIKLDKHHPMWSFTPIQLTEPLEGPDGEFLRAVIDDRPDWVLLEVPSMDSPSIHLIHLLKTSAATRRIPVVAIGQSGEILERAHRTGADDTVLASQWFSQPQDLLKHWCASYVEENPDLTCLGDLHPLAAEGISAINLGQYYQAHELLEDAWMAVDEVEGRLYRALLQIAVTYLQIQRRNWRGALKMLLRMRQWLDPLPPNCMGVDIVEVRRNMTDLLSKLESKYSGQHVPDHEGWFKKIPLNTPQRRSSTAS